MSNPTASTQNFLTRMSGRLNGKKSAGRNLSLGKQLLMQLLLLFIAFIVLFPILWIVSLSLDPRDMLRPTELRLIPPGASAQAYVDVIKRPTNNDISFPQLAFNSFKLATGTSLASVAIGILAAYSFSRFKFRGRETLMLSVVTVLMLPSIATLAGSVCVVEPLSICQPRHRQDVFQPA